MTPLAFAATSVADTSPHLHRDPRAFDTIMAA